MTSNYSAGDDSQPAERISKFTLPRLHGPSMRKSSSVSQRTIATDSGSQRDTLIGSLHDASPKDWEKEGLKKDHSMLRKRTVSNPHIAAASANGNNAQEIVNGVSGPIQQGLNILEQIGEPDHAGWMRKKGDRYNTWKLRYFLLKGPHLYCLRGNSKTVSFAFSYPFSRPIFIYCWATGNAHQGIHPHYRVQGHCRRERRSRAIWLPNRS